MFARALRLSARVEGKQLREQTRQVVSSLGGNRASTRSTCPSFVRLGRGLAASSPKNASEGRMALKRSFSSTPAEELVAEEPTTTYGHHPDEAAKLSSVTSTLADEYGLLSDDTGGTALVDEFKLDSGKVMKNVSVRYETWGELNKDRNNVVVICHALTGNAEAGTWWSSVIGPGKPVDTNKYFVFCSNALGGCYGTTGPMHTNPDTGRKYGGDFPFITMRDIVRLQEEVLAGMGITEIVSAIGGSMGGMMALEYGQEVKRIPVRSLISLCSSGRHQAWQIAISECQREAIRKDPKWLGGHYDERAPPVDGLAVARMFAMVTYRTHDKYQPKFGRKLKDEGTDKECFSVEKYLRYQGARFHERGFDAQSYMVLTQAMDAHDLGGPGRDDYYEVLKSMTMPALLVSVSSDVLYPPSEQIEVAQYMPNGQHHMIESDEGHDGFLLESKACATLIRGFLEELESSKDAEA